MICKNCGADIDASYGQCPYCGTSVSDAAQVQAPQPTQPEVQYGQNQYMPQGEQPVEDKVSVGIVILAVLIPIVRCYHRRCEYVQGQEAFRQDLSDRRRRNVGSRHHRQHPAPECSVQYVTQRRSTAQRRCAHTGHIFGTLSPGAWRITVCSPPNRLFDSSDVPIHRHIFFFPPCA